MVLSGVLTYVYLAVAARTLPADGYAAFGAYWSLALVVGAGLFLPLELEVARLVHRRGGSLPPGTGRAVAVLTVVALAAVAATAPLLLRTLGSGGLVLALAAVGLLSPAQFLLRGVLLGRGRYGLHGCVLLADAGLRVAGALAVSRATGAVTPAALGWTLVAAIGLAHVPVLAVVLAGRRAGPAAEPSRVELPAIGSLLVGTLCAQALLNAAPVLVAAGAAAGDGLAAASFVAAFTLVRLPLFVAVPLQSALIPVLVDAGVERSSAGRSRLVRRLLLAVAALAATAAVLGALAGPRVVALVFGDRYTVPATVVAVLAAGSILHLGQLVAGQALVAAGRHRDNALSWVLGLGVAAVVVAVVPGSTAPAAWAFALGSAAALTWCTVVLLRPTPVAPARTSVVAGSPGAAP